MMYRILIVDDEPYVVDWLSSLLEMKTEFELDICLAYSAEEALNWLKRAKIDIIITDIQMPEMSGIELAQEVRKNWPQCKVIFLTAYAEFDYACEAIKSNVVSYILKTEDDAHILAEVKRTIQILNQEMDNHKLLSDMQRNRESMAAVQKEILMRLLKGDYSDLPNLLAQLSDTGMDLTVNTPILLLIGKIENLPQETDLSERFQKLASIRKILDYYMETKLRCYALEYGYSQLIWIMILQEENLRDPAVPTSIFVKDILDTVQQSCMQTIGVSISFVLHGEALKAAEIPDIYLSMDQLMNQLIVRQNKFIITDSGLTVSEDVPEEEPAVLEIVESFGVNEKIKSFLYASKQKEFMMELEKTCKELEKSTCWNNPTSQELYFSTAMVLLSYINQKKLGKEITLKIDLSGLFRPYEAGSWKNAAEYLRRLSCAVFELQNEDNGKYTNYIITILREYIQAHLTEDVSLVKLSEITGYNASYLSRFYRENAGETLNDFISGQKIKIIRELMADVKLNIGEISQKTGFESRTSFNRFIKKNTGLSPQEFRENIWKR